MFNRFRKYFKRVLLFLPRLVCGKKVGKAWENYDATCNFEMNQVNGHPANGSSHPTSRPAMVNAALARSRSMVVSALNNNEATERTLARSLNSGTSTNPPKPSA